MGSYDTSEKKIVQELLQLSDTSNIQFIDTGGTSRVYLVDGGKYVVKFPRSIATKKEYGQEIRILGLLEKNGSKTLLPHIIRTHEHNDYLMYEGIIGESLDALPYKITNEIERTIGKTLGNFLAYLHSLQLEGAPTMTIDDEITQFQQKYEQVKVALTALNDHEKNILHAIVYKALPQQLKELGYDRTLCHGDLGYWNIILTQEQRIGVIDFGDIGYWDRSKDFIGMESAAMLAAALREYGDSPVLRKKIAAWQKVLAILDLSFYVEKHNVKGIEKTIQRIKNIVSAYKAHG